MRKWIYLIFGLIFSVYILISLNDFQWGIAVVAAFFFPIFLLVFLHKIDVFEREKFKNILFVFMLSFITSFLLCLLWVPLREQILDNSKDDFFYMLLGAGIPEEIIKIIPIIVILNRTKYINEPIDYLIYASSSALGFAFLENIDYIYDLRQSSPNIVAIRSLLPTFMHMSCSSIFAFGIFFYLQTRKIKYLFIFFLIAAFSHAAYNSLSSLLIFIIIIYYARLMRSLLNISPFYDDEKIKLIKKGEIILAIAFVCLHIVNFIFMIFYSNFYKSEITSQIWFLDFIFMIIAFIFYKIISHYLKIKKGEFNIIGSKKIEIFSEMQQTVINNYNAKFKDFNDL